MKKRRMALLLAAGMVLTTVSPFSLTGYAEEVIAEEAVEMVTAGEAEPEAAAEAEMEAAEETPEEAWLDEEASEDAEAELPAEEGSETVGDVPEIPTGEDDFLESVVEVEEILVEENEYAAYSMGSAEKIPEVGTYTADIGVKGYTYYFAFTPTETWGYRFYSSAVANENGNANTDDIDGKLLDSNGKQIIEDKDSGVGYNFSLAYELEAEQTYYLEVKYQSDIYIGKFPVTLEKCNWVVTQKKIEKKLELDSTLTLDPSEYLKVYGNNIPFTYQWEKVGSDGKWVKDDSTESIFKVTEEGDYRVTVSEGTRSETITFKVTVDSGLTVNSPEDPVTYVTVAPGSSVTLSVDAKTNADSLSYTWYDGNWRPLVNTPQNTPQLIVQVSGEAYYYCRIYDGYDSITRVFYVSADSGLKVISPEEEYTYVTGTVGSNITLSVNAVTNAESLSYYWYDYNDYYRENELGRNSQLTVPVSKAEYACVISDGYNRVERYFCVEPSVSGGTLSEGAGSTVTIDDAGTYVKFSFVPTETGLYRIHASSNRDDTEGTLYDGNGVFLAYNDDEGYIFNGESYGGEGPDFGIWYKLIAGETYYVTAGYLNSGATGSFTVSADLMGEKCIHSFAEVSRTAATCTTAGSVNYQCTVCTAKKTEALPATGIHSYGPYTVTAAPTALAEGTQVRTCTVCGAQETAPVAKLAPVVKLNVTSIPLKVKQSTSAVKVVEMADGDSVVSWTSGNNKVATVSKTGKITGKKKGTATITVTLASGATAQVKVKVQKNAVKTKKVTVPSRKLTLSVKEKADLGASVTPITSLQKLTYTSSNTKVASVTKKGVVTAKKKGTAKITIKSGGKKKVVKVTVK